MPLYCDLCKTIFRPEPWQWDVPEPPRTVSPPGGNGSFVCLGGGQHRRQVWFGYLLDHWLAELNAKREAEEAEVEERSPAAEEAGERGGADSVPVPKRPRLMGSEGEQTPSTVDWGSLSMAVGADGVGGRAADGVGRGADTVGGRGADSVGS